MSVQKVTQGSSSNGFSVYIATCMKKNTAKSLSLRSRTLAGKQAAADKEGTAERRAFCFGILYSLQNCKNSLQFFNLQILLFVQ